eukprot:TRINITY_DN4333_c0_g2_i1.p1 TRINITY_DN4333_c0_g2~~TRINITY_DN4333_c0_g2_i1.p1  ORF type:complete len:398 (-),score=24.44 TRINITY_DN4333_c0_g2_i1:249-1385(-)
MLQQQKVGKFPANFRCQSTFLTGQRLFVQNYYKFTRVNPTRSRIKTLQVYAKLKADEVQGMDLTPDEHHQHLKPKFIRYMAFSPQEVYFWRQFGFEGVPKDVLQAFRDYSLYHDKALKKMKNKGKSRRSTVIPETEPPNPMLYICENYPDACPVKFRRKMVAAQCDPTNDCFWWARGYWDGVPKEVREYQNKYNDMNFTEKMNVVHISEYIEMNYPGIEIGGKKIFQAYWEKPEFKLMLKREAKNLQQKIQPKGIDRFKQKARRRRFLVTWDKVLEYRRIKDETLRVLIEKKQQESQRNKIMQRFQLEVKQAKNRMQGQQIARDGRKKRKGPNEMLQTPKIVQQRQAKQKPQRTKFDSINEREVKQHVNQLQSILDNI